MVSVLKLAGLFVEDLRSLLLSGSSKCCWFVEVLLAENLFLNRQLSRSTWLARLFHWRGGAGRAAGNEDSLASLRLETSLANEVSRRPTAGP
jgi:hypothetical protein